MFYVKERVNYSTEINIAITETNVYTQCPKCGVEHMVDLVEVLADEGADLENTNVFCAKCSEEMEEDEEG